MADLFRIRRVSREFAELLKASEMTALNARSIFVSNRQLREVKTLEVL